MSASVQACKRSAPSQGIISSATFFARDFMRTTVLATGKRAQHDARLKSVRVEYAGVVCWHTNDRPTRPNPNHPTTSCTRPRWRHNIITNDDERENATSTSAPLLADMPASTLLVVALHAAARRAKSASNLCVRMLTARVRVLKCAYASLRACGDRVCV